MKKNIVLLLVLVVFVKIHAQNTLNFCKDNVYNNFPATVPEQFNGHFSLPFTSNINFHVSLNAISFGNIFQLVNDTQEGKDAALRSKKFNQLNMNLNIEVLGFGFRVKNNYFSFSHRVRAEAYGFCPGDVAKLLINGISPYAGQNLNGSIEVFGTIYNETAVGYQRKINNMFSVGGRLKLLVGQANYTTKSSGYEFCKDNDGTLLYRNNLSIRSSVPDYEILKKDATYKSLAPSIFKNFGTGIDLGFNVTFPFGLELRTSLLDLGWIRWKNVGYFLDVKHNTNFYGYKDGRIEIPDFDFTAHKLNINFTGYGFATDSIYSIWNFRGVDSLFKDAFIIEEGFKPYTSMTYPKLFFEASYNLSIHKFAFLARFDFAPKRVFPLFTLGYSINVRKVMDVAISYSIAKGYYKNLGVALAFNVMDVFHLYVATDNIIAPFAAIHSKKSDIKTTDYYNRKQNFLNIQTGIYFTIPQNNKIVNTSLMRSN
jgi:hypothetical protein